MKSLVLGKTNTNGKVAESDKNGRSWTVGLPGIRGKISCLVCLLGVWSEDGGRRKWQQEEEDEPYQTQTNMGLRLAYVGFGELGI